MDNTKKIGMVNSQKYEGIKYQVGLSDRGLVYMEIESSGIVSWSQVGKDVDMNSPNKISDALGVATEYLKTNEDTNSFKRY